MASGDPPLYSSKMGLFKMREPPGVPTRTELGGGRHATRRINKKIDVQVKQKGEFTSLPGQCHLCVLISPSRLSLSLTLNAAWCLPLTPCLILLYVGLTPFN